MDYGHHLTDEDYEAAVTASVSYVLGKKYEKFPFEVLNCLDVVGEVTKRTAEKHVGAKRVTQLLKLWKLLIKPSQKVSLGPRLVTGHNMKPTFPKAYVNACLQYRKL